MYYGIKLNGVWLFKKDIFEEVTFKLICKRECQLCSASGQSSPHRAG